MQKPFLVALVMILAVGTSVAYAAPVPITINQFGFQHVQVTGFPNKVCPADVASLGCGGAFQENIGSVANATIWCVDSQLDASQNQSYIANVVSLATPAASFDQANNVRYGGISTSGSPGWLYDLSSYGVSNPNFALTRYELAAILISQFEPSSDTPSDNQRNQSIQDAIWHLTENGSVAAQPNLSGTISFGLPSGDWIGYAANILNTGNFDFHQWAVVSGGYQCTDPSAPSLGTCTMSGADGNGVQTFLVTVTPEPRLNGVLLIGLLTLGGIVFRSKRVRQWSSREAR
jgi:hypothetical protein